MKDFTRAEAHGIRNMHPSIVGYFNYYASKYPTESGPAFLGKKFY